MRAQHCPISNFFGLHGSDSQVQHVAKLKMQSRPSGLPRDYRLQLDTMLCFIILILSPALLSLLDPVRATSVQIWLIDEENCQGAGEVWDDIGTNVCRYLPDNLFPGAMCGNGMPDSPPVIFQAYSSQAGDSCAVSVGQVNQLECINTFSAITGGKWFPPHVQVTSSVRARDTDGKTSCVETTDKFVMYDGWIYSIDKANETGHGLLTTHTKREGWMHCMCLIWNITTWLEALARWLEPELGVLSSSIRGVLVKVGEEWGDNSRQRRHQYSEANS